MRGAISIDAAAIQLTDVILGFDEPDLEKALRMIAANIGIQHISYIPLGSERSVDANLLTGICTFSAAWQARYFKKDYAEIDPVIAWGRDAVLPFDWDELAADDPRVRDFLEDAARHDVGCNGLSVPVRNRRGGRAVVSFTSNHSKEAWAGFKARNMARFQPLAVLIESAARVDYQLEPQPVELSRREEECLIWAARGKTYNDIAGILNLSFASVKTYLDTARRSSAASM